MKKSEKRPAEASLGQSLLGDTSHEDSDVIIEEKMEYFLKSVL